MNTKLKSVLVIVAKQAVNAALVTLGPVIADPAAYSLHTLHGWRDIGVTVAGAVVAREITVWLPKLMAWSNSVVAVLLVCS